MRLLGLILLIAATSNGCQKQEADTPTGEKSEKLSLETIKKKHEQIMAEDSAGSLSSVEKESEKKRENQKTIDAKFLTENFDHNVSTLEKGFRGHDPKEIYFSLLKVNYEKGKYETKLEYDERITDEMKKPFYGNVNAKSKFVFVKNISHDFDPDKKKFKFSLFDLQTEHNKGTPSRDLLVESIERVKAQDVRSNAFGSSAIVTSKTETNYYAVMYGKKFPSSFDLEGQISMPIAEAKELDQHKIALLVFGELRKPFITRERRWLEPTIANPIEKDVWNEY